MGPRSGGVVFRRRSPRGSRITGGKADALKGAAYVSRCTASTLCDLKSFGVFLARGAALGLAIASGVGCTRVGGAGPAGSGNPWTHHGVLRMADLSEPDTLNPVVGNFQVDNDLAMFWDGFLFNWSDRNEFVPELATEVPTLRNGGISADGLTIVYHLRPGVLWQDGKPFGADDVLFTWRAIMNPRNNVGSRVGYDIITRIDKRDDHTIAVHLNKPYSPFIATFLTQSSNPYPVLPAHLLAKYPDINRVPYNSQPIGTGPFILDRWQRGQKIVFRANPHYWRGPPKLKEIDYEPVPDENTIVTLLRSHEIDLEYNGAAALYAQYSNIPGYSGPARALYPVRSDRAQPAQSGAFGRARSARALVRP